MDISQAAQPPRQPAVSRADATHPLFPIYQEYRNAMIRQLVEADSFRDWLAQYERRLVEEEATRHPDYSLFRQWMVENRGGARPCPAGAFPHNFYFWQSGGRW